MIESHLMRHFDWSDIPNFLAVAETGSLALAAKALGLSKATISRRLESLEADCGERLFDRLPHQIVLNPAGANLLKSAGVMRDAADALSRDIASLDQRVRRRVRITATQSMSMFLVPHLPRLRDACPGASIELVATRAALNLARREAEIALRMRRPPDAGELLVRRVARCAISLYARSDLAAPFIRGAALSEAKDLPLVGATVDDRASLQESWLIANGLQQNIAYRISETRLRLAAVASGVGAGLLPCFAGDAEQGLVRMIPPPPELIEDAYLLKHRDLKDRPEIVAVSAALIALFKCHAAALLGASRS